MGRKLDYEYVVIGSGASGSAAALMAANLGTRTAIVEADSWGGTTLNYRDIPYAAALGFAQRYAEAIAGSRFGMSSTTLRYNYPTVLNWQATAVRRAGGGSRRIFESAGIDCYRGFAQFVNPYEIEIDNLRISSEKFLLATGTTLSVGGIAGIDRVNCWSPDTALRMAKLPKVLLIVGGGSTGCELAEYFAALGVNVILLEAGNRILPREDAEVSTVIERHLRDRFGVNILTGARVFELRQDEHSEQVIFVQNGQKKAVRVESIIIATAPEPALDFGLENAGVKYSPTGIEVDQNLRTSNHHIWAAGDVLGGESSAERSTYEGKLATMNAIQKSNTVVNYTGFTRLTNTLPKVAKVGLNEQDCEKIGQKYRSTIVPLDEISASNTNDFRAGFVKILVDLKSQVIGATVVSPDADLVVQELALSVRCGLKVSELAGTPHVAMSWSEAVRVAARQLA